MFAQNPGTGFTIWITGMQGAGKSVLARELVQRLKRLEKPVELLEGPEWDVFIGKGPGETKDERNAIVRRAGFVARALTRAGGFVIVPQVSPIRETREALRREIGRFLEVFVDAPFHTLMERDSGGLYKKAMSGEIPNFIGVTDPYEPPANPEVKLDTSRYTIDDEATRVMEALVREGALQPSDIGLSKTPPPPKEEGEGKKSKEPPAPILFTADLLRLPKPQPRPEGKAAPVKAAAPPLTKPAKATKAVKEEPKKAAKPAKAAKEEPKKAAKAAPAKAARTREEAKAPAKPARARAAAPVKAARKKSAAKTARAAKPAPAKAAKKAPPAKKAAKGKKGKR